MKRKRIGSETVCGTEEDGLHDVGSKDGGRVVKERLELWGNSEKVFLVGSCERRKRIEG